MFMRKTVMVNDQVDDLHTAIPVTELNIPRLLCSPLCTVQPRNYLYVEFPTDSTWLSSCGHPVWNIEIRPRPCGCRESVWNWVDSTRSSSRGKLLWCLFRRFHEWECLPEWDFPLHWGWGKLAELWLAGLVWTPRLGVPQIPSAGSWGQSTRSATATGSYTPIQGDGRGLPRPTPKPPGYP